MKKLPEVPGIIFDIQRFSIHNGPGIRTTVFLKGCPLRCQWCHNPESWDFAPHLSFKPAQCIACGACAAACPSGACSIKDGRPCFDKATCHRCGACAAACPAAALKILGVRMNVAEVMAEVVRDVDYYKASGGGLTLGGGEPLAQFHFTVALLKAAQAKGLHTAIETCGDAPWEQLGNVLAHTDIVLYDLKHMDSAEHKRLTGMPNERILANLQRFRTEFKTPLIIRIPVVPGCNASANNIRRTADFVAPLRPHYLQLLSYNRLARSKHDRLGLAYQPGDQFPPPAEMMQQLKCVVEQSGVTCVVD